MGAQPDTSTSAPEVWHGVQQILAPIFVAKLLATYLGDAVEHFCKVTRSYRPGLFHCYSVPDLPRTNNDLEHEFGSQRSHERRASGRKTASPALLLRGEARLIAVIATRQHPPSGADLGRVDRERWNDLRQRLNHKRQARILRTRFRRNPDAYLAELEQKAYQLTLPA